MPYTQCTFASGILETSRDARKHRNFLYKTRIHFIHWIQFFLHSLIIHNTIHTTTWLSRSRINKGCRKYVCGITFSASSLCVNIIICGCEHLTNLESSFSILKRSPTCTIHPFIPPHSLSVYVFNDFCATAVFV